jgi:hypothetical protein
MYNAGMSERITYRCAERIDAEKMADLINNQYARKKTVKYFFWQYFDSPLPSFSMTAWNGNELIGMFGVQQKILSDKTKAVQFIDLLIKKEWRGKGIFRELSLRAFALFPEAELFFVLPNKNGKDACEKLGLRTIAKIDTLIFRGKPKKPARKTPDKAGKYLHIVKKSADIKWRFKENPDYTYEKISIAKNGNAQIKVFTDPVSGTKYGDIVDVTVKKSDAYINVVKKALAHFQKNNIGEVTIWAFPHTEMYPKLLNEGFIPVPQERYFCINVLDKKHKNLYNIKMWDLQESDTEFF